MSKPDTSRESVEALAAQTRNSWRIEEVPQLHDIANTLLALLDERDKLKRRLE